MKVSSIIISILLSLFFFALVACEEEAEPEKEKKNINWSRKKSTDLNKGFAREEEIDIRLYLKRRPEWEMTSTGSGLQYWVYEDKPGETAKEDDLVEVTFEVRLLDDSLVYQTEPNEVSAFKVDKSNVETGVQEGIKYLSEGDKAKLIIPSHLGHGLLGDFNKIPPLQVLIVDIELKKIK